MTWIGTSVSMTETWTMATLAGIGYYGRDLDINNFGWTTIARIWTSATLVRSDYYVKNWANYGHETSSDIFFF
jgi:hypothetical protein